MAFHGSINRNDLKQLTKIRINDAKILLKNGNYDGAYYLSGYAVECGLKACIAKNTKKYDFPDFKTVKASYTHDLEDLVGVAGLTQALIAEKQKNQSFSYNWTIVKDWDEEHRYKRNHTRKEASDLYNAIIDTNGVLIWIKHNW